MLAGEEGEGGVVGKKLPAMLFYPGDWRKAVDVQSLTYEQKGIWFEMLCFMHEARDRGKLEIETLPQLLGLDQAKVKQIVEILLSKGVADRDGDFILNRRMVKQEQIKGLRKIYGSIGGQVTQAKAEQGVQAKSSSFIPSSSSSSNQILKYFGKKHLEKLGEKYTSSFQKDHTLLQRLLENHSEKKLEEMIDRFFRDDNDFVRQAGYTVGVFSSQVPKMLLKEHKLTPVPSCSCGQKSTMTVSGKPYCTQCGILARERIENK
jgi:ribosomal protein S17E